MKFIHLTDLHLLEPGNLIWGIDAHAKTQACLEDIAHWHSDAEFCIISGDLTDRAELSAYAWLDDALKVLEMPVHLMIGNHDDRAAFQQAFPSVPRDANGFSQTSIDTPEGRFILLDTFKGGTSAGQLCEQRQHWLADRLDEAGPAPVWLFMHHPPCDVGIPYMDRIKLDEHEDFADILAGRDNIRHIFFGHVHRAVYVNWRGIPCTALPSLCHQIPLDRGMIAGKPYATGPGMYGVVLIDESQTTVHFEYFEDRAAAKI